MTEYVLARSDEVGHQGNFWSTFTAPAVARIGTSFDVVFSAVLSQGFGSPGYQGVFVDRQVTTSLLPPASLITTLDTITVPGLGSNLTITFASHGATPSISDGGGTAFGIAVLPGQHKQVLLTRGPAIGDLLRVVSFEGMTFSGSPSGSMLLAAVPFAIASNGDVGFRASTATATANSSGMFRWDAQSAALQLVAHTDQPADGTSDVFNLIAHPTNQPFVAKFGDTARSAFRASIKASQSSTTDSGNGIWVDHPVAGVSNVADTYTDAPGVLPLTKFVDFYAPAVNSTGAVAFRGCLNAGCGNDGLWTGQPNSLSLVVRQGNPAPDPTGAPSGETFVDFSNPVLNENGAIAFRGVTGSYEGIWRRASQFGPELKRIVQKDDFLRGTSLQFVAFGADLAIADTGELAFTATMSDGKLGLFTTMQLGANPVIVKIAKVGEAFDFTPSQTKVIASILFHPGAYAMGTSGFNHVASSPAQPQGVGFALAFEGSPTSRALVLSTVE